MSQALRFDDDVVIVTGGGRGLGREYALAFASRGARVVVNDIGASAAGDSQSHHPAQGVVDEIVAAGGMAISDCNSVSRPAGAQALVKAAVKAFGKVSVLVNNAGIISFSPLTDMTNEQWRRMMNVTLDGAFYMCQAVWPVFAASKYGRIVNTTSNAGFAGNETQRIMAQQSLASPASRNVSRKRAHPIISSSTPWRPWP